MAPVRLISLLYRCLGGWQGENVKIMGWEEGGCFENVDVMGILVAMNGRKMRLRED